MIIDVQANKMEWKNDFMWVNITFRRADGRSLTKPLQIWWQNPP